MSPSSQDPIPYYGLPDAFEGKRRLEGGGWDVNEIMNRPIGGRSEIGVRLTRRRLTGRTKGPRPLTPPETARNEAATSVVMAAGATMQDHLGEIAYELALSDHWAPTIIEIDGKDEMAHELVYNGAWVVQHIGEDILIAVVGSPDAARPERLAIERLDPRRFGFEVMTGPNDPPIEPTDWTG